MNTYELVVMYNPDLKEADLKAVVEELKSRAKDLGGSLDIADDMGLKKLAYKIGKFDQAYYHIYNLQIESTKANEIVSFLNHREGVIRNLLSVIDKEL